MDESIERLAHDIGGSFQSRSKRFAITAARRLAAILAVDVVGYSLRARDLLSVAVELVTVRAKPRAARGRRP